MRQQRGFTLLELMVAMAIFAMLAVAGWQVFDGVNRARERAQYHADQLAVLQYAYLQLQQDMGQIIAYPAPAAQDGSSSNNNNNNGSNSNNNHSNNNNNRNNPADPIIAEPFMSLNGEQVSFVRFADPDPRYQSSPSIQRVEYIFADERLIRRQYTSIQGGADSISLDTVLLEGVTAGRWQAYLPELSPKFPNADSQNNQRQTNSNNPASGQTATGEPEVTLLPKGVGVSFTYQDNTLSWQWALAPQALPPIGNNMNRSDANNNSNNDDNNNNGNNSGNNLENSSENPPNGQ